MDICKKRKCNVHKKQKEWTYTKKKSAMSIKPDRMDICKKEKRNIHKKQSNWTYEKYLVKMF